MAAKKGSARFVSGLLKEAVEFAVVKVSVNVTAELGDRTPVLTGWAASNWIPSIGESVEVPFGSKEAVSDGAKEAGLALVATSYALPQIVYVTNPVYYIEDLNRGTSKKAPRFFVETAIAKGIKSVV